MGKQGTRDDKGSRLMGDDIVGIYLSEELLSGSQNATSGNETKLGCFAYHAEVISHPRLLGGGEHGVVILAVIHGRKYALKLFKNWMQPGPVYSPYDQAIYTSPLANESRAFARLNSRNKNGTWAVRCYGWMKLSDAQFETIGHVVDTQALSRWVVVKEYLPEVTNSSHVEEIYKNFKIARKARLLPQDVRLENYRGTKIVDLSSTLTDPCLDWQEFEFNFFYQESACGVFDWFPSKQPSTCLLDTFALVPRLFRILNRTK